MNILFTILLLLLSLIALLLLVALFMKKDHYVQREIIINVPQQKAFDFLKLLKNQDKFNKWAKEDAERSWEYKGTDGTVGFIISWNGNKKVGEGEKEIMNLVEGKRIETQIRFVRPMKTVANIIMETEFVTDNQTKIIMSNAGTLSYPINVMIPIVEKMFPKDIDCSLLVLKKLIEE
jgi:hypothetical protein